MKKSLFVAAIAAISLVACKKTEAENTTANADSTATTAPAADSTATPAAPAADSTATPATTPADAATKAASDVKV